MKTMPANSIELITTEDLVQELLRRSATCLVAISERRAPHKHTVRVYVQPELLSQFEFTTHPKGARRISAFLAELKDGVDEGIQRGAA